ncbi:hypothetical protein [Streptomyces olivochromogenes]|uniref:Uncharacterized protein n=1 Tax=Streptomyces olivochromogenes TaxID=1963 RepID=A0A250VT69_STROL|nr:hypothetical protein [Streptomyces olivochromogenes]KUN38268.1 hypothetical protein AQJ27_45025 [Streptomyces olivochromogenes]GAX57289.1 hypothetical protein SO3561_08859 [Streptomyces olivochromogenes]
MAAADERREIPEMVTFTEIAKRVTDRQLVPRPITRQGVRHIAETDPAWPVPAEKWMKIGNAWAMPWEPVEEFFKNREVRGRGPAKAQQRQPEVGDEG